MVGGAHFKDAVREVAGLVKALDSSQFRPVSTLDDVLEDRKPAASPHFNDGRSQEAVKQAKKLATQAGEQIRLHKNVESAYKIIEANKDNPLFIEQIQKGRPESKAAVLAKYPEAKELLYSKEVISAADKIGGLLKAEPLVINQEFLKAIIQIAGKFQRGEIGALDRGLYKKFEDAFNGLKEADKKELAVGDIKAVAGILKPVR